MTNRIVCSQRLFCVIFLLIAFIAQAENFTPVNNIAGVPGAAVAGIPLYLSGTVQPANATFNNIEWAILNAGGTGAVITGGNRLYSGWGGTVTVRATVPGGTAQGRPFIQTFRITFIVPADNITGVPTHIMVGEPIYLHGIVQPAHAVSQNIVWTLANDGGTGAAFIGRRFTASREGTATIRATIANAALQGGFITNFIREFQITVLSTAPVAPPPHTAVEIESFVEAETVSQEGVAWLTLAVALGLDTEEPGEAFSMAEELGWLPSGTEDIEDVTLGDLSLLMMRAFDLEGSGLMFRLTGSRRHAFREMRNRGLIAGRPHPSLTISGEDFLRMLGNTAAYSGAAYIINNDAYPAEAYTGDE